MIVWLGSVWQTYRQTRLIQAWHRIQQDPDGPVALVLLDDLSTWYVDCPPDESSTFWMLSRGGEECEIPGRRILDIQGVQLAFSPAHA